MIIGICGYGFTGSGAVLSLLKEFENVRTLPGGHDDAEFNISYYPDGIEDLEYHLCVNPAKGTGSDTAIYRFTLLVRDSKRSYNRYTNNNFTLLSTRYLNELIQVRWPAYRNFEYERQKWHIFGLIKWIKIVLSVWLKQHHFDKTFFKINERYLSIMPEDFILKSRKYIGDILDIENRKEPLVLNQPFSATNPLNSMKFFYDPYCIIVDRDPRDLYVMVKYVYGKTAMFIPTDDVANFVNYYKIMRKKIINNNKIMYIHFEDLVYKYEETVDVILCFLENKIGVHTNCKSYFDPDISKKNTHIFRYYPNEKSAIKYIEKHLNEYLYSFPEESINNLDDLTDFTFM